MARPGASVSTQHLQNAQKLFEAGRIAEAKAQFLFHLRQNPRSATALIGLGRIAFRDDIDAAQSFFERAVQASPSDVPARVNLAYVFSRRNEYSKALEQLIEANRRDPRSQLAQDRLTELYMRLRMFDAAAVHAAAVARLDESNLDNFFASVRAKRAVCDWQSFEADEQRMLAACRAGARFNPFVLLTASSTLEDQQQGARQWAEPFVRKTRLATRRREPGERIRVGYLSNDFRGHATAYLIADLIQAHDRSRFDIRLLSFEGGGAGSAPEGLLARADGAHDLTGLSEIEAAKAIAALGIDILVDLKGYSLDAKPEILGFRPAPIQVNYLAFPGTMGAPFIDYVICDAQVCPASYQRWCDEKIIHLDFFQPSQRKRAVRETPFTREELGLPAGAFVFCSFAATYKLTPAMGQIWARILAAVPDSVLWLYARSKGTRANLLRAAESVGLPSGRIVFADYAPQSDHLRRLQAADLMLDTLPVSAFTTASDAVWAGLPLLTCAGSTSAGRGGAAVLSAAGMPELITNSPAEYEARAIALANDRPALAALRERLTATRATSRVFDGTAHARNLEKAYAEMVRRHEAGLPPAPFATADI